MASVNVYSVAKIDELLSGGVVSAALTDGHLILTHQDGGTTDVGSVVSSVPDASDTVKGVVELATDTDTATGTDTNRAVTPFGLAALVSTETNRGLVELATSGEVVTGTDTVRAVTPAGLADALAFKQNADIDLTAIAGLSPSNDDIIQRKAGGWTNRTLAQLATDLMTTNEFVDARLHNGTSYVDSDGAHLYVGPTDPGSVTNGSIWFDTTGA